MPADDERRERVERLNRIQQLGEAVSEHIPDAANLPKSQFDRIVNDIAADATIGQKVSDIEETAIEEVVISPEEEA